MPSAPARTARCAALGGPPGGLRRLTLGGALGRRDGRDCPKGADGPAELALASGVGLWLVYGVWVGVLPLIYDKRPGAEGFIAKFKKQYDRNPGTEASYHYSTLNAVAEAMKMAGTVSDPKAIHAKLSEAYGKLSPEKNPARITKVADFTVLGAKAGGPETGNTAKTEHGILGIALDPQFGVARAPGIA